MTKAPVLLTLFFLEDSQTLHDIGCICWTTVLNSISIERFRAMMRDKLVVQNIC